MTKAELKSLTAFLKTIIELLEENKSGEVVEILRRFLDNLTAAG